MLLPPFLTGFGIGFGLIVAIGAQNAFVLRQGLKREHVFAVAFTCALADAALIALGVAGLGALIEAVPGLLPLVAGGGLLFLLAYGLLALKRAVRPGALDATGGEGPRGLRPVLAACLAFTLLNPHVYLDTVLLVGSLAAPFSGAARWAYGIGAATASFVWFFGLAYGARLLAPLFARPVAWRVLDALIAIVMFAIAGKLALWLGSTLSFAP